jgi:membrane fusion protein (multidrug efflux system)
VTLGKQIGIVGLILLAVAVGGYWYADSPGVDADAATGSQREPAAVEVAVVAPTTLARRIEAVGTTLARQSVDILPAASGRIVAIEFDPGSLVEAGSTLVRLDDGAEQADVAEAEAERLEAELALERAKKLAAGKSIAQATVDQLDAAYRAADARLLRAQKDLAERTVRAPFAGRVGLKQVNIGARVDDATVIATLDDLAEIEVDFSVPEIFFGIVAEGQSVKATSTAFGARVFEGAIATVDSRIDRVSRAFRVRARIPNDDLTLPAGMFMLVDLTLDERQALTVPEEAVMVTDDQASVFVVADGRAERRTVTLGQREIGLVEIIDGLETGEQVVVTGTQRVRSDAPVRVTGSSGTAGPTDRSQPTGPDAKATPTSKIQVNAPAEPAG